MTLLAAVGYAPFLNVNVYTVDWSCPTTKKKQLRKPRTLKDICTCTISIPCQYHNVFNQTNKEDGTQFNVLICFLLLSNICCALSIIQYKNDDIRQKIDTVNEICVLNNQSSPTEIRANCKKLDISF